MKVTFLALVFLGLSLFFLLPRGLAYSQYFPDNPPESSNEYFDIETDDPDALLENLRKEYLEDGFTILGEGYKLSAYNPSVEFSSVCGHFIDFTKYSYSEKELCNVESPDPGKTIKNEYISIRIDCKKESTGPKWSDYTYVPSSVYKQVMVDERCSREPINTLLDREICNYIIPCNSINEIIYRAKPNCDGEEVTPIDIPTMPPSKTIPSWLGEGKRTTPPELEICQYPPKEEIQRQEVMVRIKEKYGFEVVDSDLCGQETCGNNSIWSPEELAEMESALNNLPECFTKKMRVDRIGGRSGEGFWSSVTESLCCQSEDLLKQRGTGGGYTFYDNNIVFCGRVFAERGNTIKEWLTHELTHAFQYGTAPLQFRNAPDGAYLSPVVQKWIFETGWDQVCLPLVGCLANGVPEDLPTDYAKETKNPLEDMAESVRLYVTDPDLLKQVSPRRYKFIRKEMMCDYEY